MLPRTPTDKQIAAAAHELASQEQYNPNWVKLVDGWQHGSLYKRRAQLILEAALNAEAER